MYIYPFTIYLSIYLIYSCLSIYTHIIRIGLTRLDLYVCIHLYVACGPSLPACVSACLLQEVLTQHYHTRYIAI